MEIEIEDVDSCNKKIKFVVPHQDYKKEVDKYYQKLGREVKVPGFRKGKVPRHFTFSKTWNLNLSTQFLIILIHFFFVILMGNYKFNFLITRIYIFNFNFHNFPNFLKF